MERWPHRAFVGVAVGWLSIFGPSLVVAGDVADDRGAVSPPPAFTALFNGKDLTGWQGLVGNPKTRRAMPADTRAAKQSIADKRMHEHWHCESGVLHFDGSGDNLCTVKDYRDFELLVEWRIEKNGDSGIYLRGSPQIQIWDTDNPKAWPNGADQGSGALWNNRGPGNRPLVKADRPAGQWNHFRIKMIGETLWVWLNGQLVLDRERMENYWERDRPIYAEGPIELQNHGNHLYFRNVFVREIGAEEAARELRGPASQFRGRPLFNGRDFTGWVGATSGYQIEDGVLSCKPGSGGNLFTANEYSDFVLQFEFRLPPRGNNGLAIRAPLEGDPAYSGMELQILDNSAPQYASLKAYQYHGSIYALVPAIRGYQRPVGEWNFEEVRACGTRIEVHLNGTRILSTDLKDLTSDGKSQGWRRTSGHIGFCGHNDPVAFRHIRIRELPPPR